MQFAKLTKTIVILAALLLLAGTAAAANVISGASFEDEHSVGVEFAAPVDAGWDWQGKVAVFERQSPDILMSVQDVVFAPDRKSAEIVLAETVSKGEAYVIRLRDVQAGGASYPEETFLLRKGFFAVILTIVLTYALIQNFVFSKYLGLCIFFGTSGRKETAIGMGLSFTFVVLMSSVFVWALYTFALKPLHLGFLQVLTFVGIIAIFVQFLDTILRKVNPYLFKKLGVYLVLITTNCIILAVPLILVDNAYNPFESLALALGAGLGFLLAMYLMAAVRERIELADIPDIFRGLPIAFVVAALFALAFLGFSGMSV